MTSAGDFTRMVPGFDFLQGLMRNAGAGLPPMNQWIAPTLDPAELEKRIQDLRTVQFWLEQNARLLGTTIQALEVQRMTLSTLQTMNLPLADLGRAMQAHLPAGAASPSPSPPPPPPPPEPAPAPPPPSAASGSAGDESEAASASAATRAASGLVDPMKWWGALTQQFTEIAAQALKDGGSASAGAEAAAAPSGKPAKPSARGAGGSSARASARGSTAPAGAASSGGTGEPARRSAPAPQAGSTRTPAMASATRKRAGTADRPRRT